MSIRGRGIDTVEVQNYKLVRVKGRAEYVPDGEPIKLENVDVQSVREWASSEEYREHGLRIYTLARLFCRDFPGSNSSRVFWNDEQWEVVGSVQEFKRTRRTSHVMVTLRLLDGRNE